MKLMKSRTNGRSSPRRKLAILLTVLVLCVGVACFFVFRAGDRRPSIVLISIDTLRPDHLGCYGYSRDTSPVIDKLAAEGTLFETVISSTSWTLPAHAALFTSLPDRVHGCTDDLRWLDGSRETLAEALKAEGYTTAGFFSGPYLHPSFGFSQGFDSYHDCTSYSRESIDLLKSESLVGENGQLSRDLMDRSHEDITNPIVLSEVRSWLDSNSNEPFFLFIHFWDVHYDYVAPAPYDTMFDPGYEGPVDGRNLLRATRKPEEWTQADVDHLRALYDAEIRYTDDTLGQIVDDLERLGILDSSVIAVTADHGEAFYEHGLFGHRWSLFDEEIRIPLVVRYPDVVPSGRRLTGQVEIIDIAPTLLDLAGAPPLPHAVGRSLVPLLEDPPGAWDDEPAVCELSVPANRIHQLALRSETWKLIFHFNKKTFNFFDLEADPGETSPVGLEQSPFTLPEVEALYERTAKALEKVARSLPTPGERDTPPISEMTEAQLRSLGYLK